VSKKEVRKKKDISKKEKGKCRQTEKEIWLKRYGER